MPSALLIGNGPSASFLQEPDLNHSFFRILNEKNISTFCMNKYVRLFGENVNLPNPDYYVCADALVMVDIASEIEQYIDRFKKLFLAFPYGYDQVQGRLLKLPNLSTPYPDRSKYMSYEKISKKLKTNPSVISTRHRVTGLQSIIIAVSLGYTEIYLIGLDESYSPSLDENDLGGFVHVDNSLSTSTINNENYAFKNYIKPGDIYSLGNENRIPAFQAVGSELISDPSLSIYNLSDISRITIFPKLKLSELLEDYAFEQV